MPNKSERICEACLKDYTGPNENRTLMDLDGVTCPHYRHNPDDDWDAMKDPYLISFMDWEP